MSTVRVEPDAHVLQVHPDETLIEAAWRLGYFWPTTCYGRAECTTCHIEILEGSENASAVGDEEKEALSVLGTRGRLLRLACRVKFEGDVVVRKRGVRAPA
jgi:ferredoxin, 2Fe-2S